MDTHADMCCVGQNFTPYTFTGDEYTVSPYNDEYKPIENVKVCSAATAVDDTNTGQTIICYVNLALYFGNSLENSQPDEIAWH